MEGEGDTEVKDEESGDIWRVTPKSKIHSECDILEELWGNWPIKGEADIACDCKEEKLLKLLSHSTRISDRAWWSYYCSIVVWWFITLRWSINIRLWLIARLLSLILLSQLGILRLPMTFLKLILSAYRNCTRRRQPLCKAYSDDSGMT
jgi:hypothetical protein